MSEKVTMEKIVSLAKRRGFIYPSSEIYGGISSCWDYGPVGVELKNRVKCLWWRTIVQERMDVVGLDAAIIMSPKVWQASGHLTEGFADPLVECKECGRRYRADKLAEETEQKEGQLRCPECGGELGEERKFNLMMKTFIGPVEDSSAETYLRAETCQGIYVNFENVRDSARQKIPFGIAQIGKAFRNEITPGNFTFRMREFEQMEMQYFIHPDDRGKYFEEWKKVSWDWLLDLGIKEENLRWHEHGPDELAHYASQAFDIEYKFPFGFSELQGVHDRGDWDLSSHSKGSGKDLSYFDDQKQEKFLPNVVETSIGADRAALVFLLDAYDEEEIKGETRVVLRFDKRVAPFQVAVLPLSKKEELIKPAVEIFKQLSPKMNAQFDQTGSIGKRYRRQDEIGTPYCLTVDFDSLEDKKVTVRDRDSMEQERVAMADLEAYLTEKLA